MSGCAGKVVNMETEAGKSFSKEEIKTALETHKPAVLFLCQVRSRPADSVVPTVPCHDMRCECCAMMSPHAQPVSQASTRVIVGHGQAFRLSAAG